MCVCVLVCVSLTTITRAICGMIWLARCNNGVFFPDNGFVAEYHSLIEVTSHDSVLVSSKELWYVGSGI